MKKRLILVGGPMGVGKTALCRELKKLAAPCAFLDGDWCWDMEPFQVTEETKALVQANIATLLGRYLACGAFQNVVFCWVMHQRETVEALLAALPLEGVEVTWVTLLAREETLRRRIGGDVAAGLRTWDVLERSLERLAHCRQLGSALLWTDGLTPAQGAREVWELAQGT